MRVKAVALDVLLNQLLSSMPTISAKKTDVAEHPRVFRHIGLLFNEPPGTARLPFI
jgi:hypothetical protein